MPESGNIMEINGIVEKACPGAKFVVRLDNGQQVMAYLSGKMRQNQIRILEGDSVAVEISCYDLEHGRIVWRNSI